MIYLSSISLPTSNAPKIMVLCFPPCLLTGAHPLHTPLHCRRLFLVGCCVNSCWSAAVQRQRCFFLFFCRSICHPQTIIRRPPHTFHRDCVSSIMIPSLLTPMFGWLLCLTKWRPPKAKTPSLSLFFEGSHFDAPSKGTSHGDHETRHRAFAVEPWGVAAPRFGGATALPMEKEGIAAGG